ncbi:MAG TPA: hypothetical protein VFN25_16275 [Dokdonella sp.]|uniref:hypothetical protein n=1 Tax=Dokdonella sp. TaxID=2291710 RepID=UPI002D80C032|nr:hypothetical protein [Dokdonella sp.]HET9034448.1 hypothetical protein [Dokdonella sp.]
MTDFELRRQLRELRGPRQPERDLWPQIARRLSADFQPAAVTVRRRARWPLAIAAGLVMAVSVGLFSLSLHDRVGSVASEDATLPSELNARHQIQRARELAASGDPRLVSAEVVLDVASSELDHALAQQPDAIFLVGLINRTHAQRRKLARLGLDAS